MIQINQAQISTPSPLKREMASQRSMQSIYLGASTATHGELQENPAHSHQDYMTAFGLAMYVPNSRATVALQYTGVACCSVLCYTDRT